MGHLHGGILLGREKEDNSTLCDSTIPSGADLEGIVLSAISQSESDKHRATSLLCGIERTDWTDTGNGVRLVDGEQGHS